MGNLFFHLTLAFTFFGLVLEFGLNSLFCSFSGLDSGLDVYFLVWISDMGFWFSIWIWISDWIFSGFLAKRSSSMDYARQGSGVTRIRLRT